MMAILVSTGMAILVLGMPAGVRGKERERSDEDGTAL
jgi:hypothetical protein